MAYRRMRSCSLWVALAMAGLGCGVGSVDDLSEDKELLAGEVTLWSRSTVPNNPSNVDRAAVELGVKFRASVAGNITGIRFYKGSRNTGTHTGHLWTSTGELLATVAFTQETRNGWQVARFSAPVAISPGTVYVASYFAPRGYYAGDNGYFSTTGRTAGPLSALSDNEQNGNGVYRYGDGKGFPRDSWKASNYYVDVLFVPAGVTSEQPEPPTPPTTPELPAPPTTPTTTACVSVPSRCGYPDGTNTGPAAGTVFRRVPADVTSGPGWAWESNFGRLRVTGTGAELNGLDVSGPVVIDAPNVVLRNSIVTSCDSEGDVVAVRGGNASNGYNGTGAQILNNRLRCNTSGKRARSGVRDVYGGATNMVVNGNDISGTGNGITIEGGGMATDNWIHDLGHLAGDHHSGLSNHGGASKVTYSHNTVLLANTSTAGGGGLSGAITIYGDFARAQNVTVTDNFVSGGAYTFYGGINNEDKYGQPIEIHIDRNRIVCNAWVYGPVFRRTGATNSFTGNYCDQTLAPVGG